MLEGTAVFSEDGVPGLLSYQVACDPAWRTERGMVNGWLGARTVHLAVARANESQWTLNGTRVPGLDGCVDLDLGFTPATNLLQLKRCALAIGEAADVPVAWLDPSAVAVRLEVVPQRYERRAETAYWYESPRFDYAGLLELTPDGFIRSYPGLWELEAP